MTEDFLIINELYYILQHIGSVANYVDWTLVKLYNVLLKSFCTTLLFSVFFL